MPLLSPYSLIPLPLSGATGPDRCGTEWMGARSFVAPSGGTRMGDEAQKRKNGYAIARTFPIARAIAARRDASRETARARKQARETVRDQAAVVEGH
jgi:hypothetical protein